MDTLNFPVSPNFKIDLALCLNVKISNQNLRFKFQDYFLYRIEPVHIEAAPAAVNPDQQEDQAMVLVNYFYETYNNFWQQ